MSPALFAHPEWGSLFAHPEWLAALAGAWLACGVALAAAARRERRRRRRLGAGIARSGRRLDSDLALWLALGTLALALAGPRVTERMVEQPASGVDVVFLVDVSRSMDAQDVAPSRLARARRAVEEILPRLDASDRFALAAFAGRGVLLTPLTPDRDVLAELLGGLATDLVAPASSRIDEGLRAALTAFEPGSPRPRVVLLLGDGEDPERRRDLGSAPAVRSDVRVLAAGFGSEIGSQLDDHGAPLLGLAGQPVVSRRDLERLERLAAETGGRLFAADAWGELDLDALCAEIRRDAAPVARASSQPTRLQPELTRLQPELTLLQPELTLLRRVRSVPVVPLAALAFALLWIEGMPRPRLPKRLAWRRGLLSRTASAGAVLALCIATLPAPAGHAQQATLSGHAQQGTLAALEAELRARPDDARAWIELGIARLERGQRDAAARAFLGAALSTDDPEAAGIAYFDLGVVALEQGDYAGARAAFLDALAWLPGDPQARFNLEWTLEALRQRPAPPDPPERASRDVPPPTPGSPATQADGRSANAAPAPLSPEEQRRWLERVRDDPGRALRAAAAAEAPAGGERTRGPAW